MSMSIPKTLVFIDGENLVFRYQAMLSEGRTAKPAVVHISDVFLWHPDMTQFGFMNVSRVYFYTSVVGDDRVLEDTKEAIGTTTYGYEYEDGKEGTAEIVPLIFKKPAKSYKSRQVDIQIAIDMMRFAHNPAIDLLCLFSGDGDYLPLIEELMRHGKEVVVGAFSSGRAPQLKWFADEFIDLDEIFFKPQSSRKSRKPGSSSRSKPAKKKAGA
jgi:uncharacterized LabA/DUF88 family protein